MIHKDDVTEFNLHLNSGDVIVLMLDRCPFCGNPPTAQHIGNDRCKKQTITIGCEGWEGCNFRLLASTKGRTPPAVLAMKLANRWNGRYHGEGITNALKMSAAWGGDPNIPEKYTRMFRAIADNICPT